MWCPSCSAYVVHAKYTSEKHTCLPPGLTRCHQLLPSKVVLHDSGTNRVVLHDRKSGVGCSSSTTLFLGL
ncbi:hypothetical protein HMPREF9237_00318 [Actinotignum schaalii FB123-CNA-2]|uniref:Uncharacterized protein n=1 Tax=Actinotignum schaalii FB123-CNA-2 TaxID=883067 RepID=S2W585_9ACTO|nr:hypothetical protein HMPREF9237_00318 [Actinotignum schaalii FB123-CNA-2]